jgi:hypothetical protein
MGVLESMILGGVVGLIVGGLLVWWAVWWLDQHCGPMF